MSKQIYLSDSKEKLVEGVNLLADAVKSTLGPSGKTVIIANGQDEPFTTKDGVTVAMEMEHIDPIINAAIQLVKKVASKMDMDSGDGTTTATVLCRELIVLGMKARENDFFDDHEFKNMMHKELEYIISKILENAVEIPLEEIHKVAFTSANQDEEIASLFQQAFNNAGADGYINIMESPRGKSYVDIINGFVLELGYADRKFANNINGFFQAEKCKVVLYDNEFTDKNEILKLIDRSSRKNPLPIVIFAKDFSTDVNRIVDFNNSDRIGDKICLIKNYHRNDEYTALMNDLAHYTGAEIIQHFDEFDSEFGEACNVIVKPGYTILGAVEGTRLELLNDYLALLEMAAKEEKSPAYATQYRKRIDKMKNGITTYYVGGSSDVEIKEKRHRVEDAYKACKAALKDKVIVGGGQSLVLLSKRDQDIEYYESIFYESIKKPFQEILKNSLHSERDIEHIANEIIFERGYNAKTREFENLYESGIVDPTSVVINGLKNAVSIALTILSTECVIVATPNNYNNSI